MEFFGYTKCSTCRNAHKALKDKGYDIPFHDFVQSPPTPETLSEWIKGYGQGVKPFINAKGTRYKELGLKDRTLTDEEWVNLLSTDGKLLKRPVLVLQDKVIVGYDKSAYDLIPNHI